MDSIVKKFIKIFVVTVGIQIFGTISGFVLDMTFKQGFRIFLLFIIIGYITALVTDICMSIKSDTLWYKKLALILFMPTNYTVLLLPWFAMDIFAKFFQNLPTNL